MPRLSHELIRQARNLDPLLPLLLRPCRDLASARNELRWLREHVSDERAMRSNTSNKAINPTITREKELWQLCLRRSKGEPLQYILGTQPFGELEILCRPNVLIPRPDTESYTTYLARLLLEGSKEHPNTLTGFSESSGLRILDLCTGTGCIALLLYSLLSKEVKELRVRGVDISASALSLARENLVHNVKHSILPEAAIEQVDFAHGDILDSANIGREGWDVVVSNPPYISRSSFWRNTERSVRLFEPRSALVPKDADMCTVSEEDRSGDAFYERILAIGERAKARLIVMEVEDEAQADRVLSGSCSGLESHYWHPKALWRDGLVLTTPCTSNITRRRNDIEDIGTGSARAIVFTKSG